MFKDTPKNNTTESTSILLKEYREKQKQSQLFVDYDEEMSKLRTSSTSEISKLNDPLKSVASRLFSIIDQGYFLHKVYDLKIDYLAEALIHSIDAKNPLSLANNTRALVEHIAALVTILKDFEKLEQKLEGQTDEKAISLALTNAELFIQRAYYGTSPKRNNIKSKQALHVNDCLKIFKSEVSDIEDVYDFLCEYVHPNYGSNLLVTSGNIASGRLNPPEEYHREILNRLRQYCSQCMLFLKEREVEHISVFIRLTGLLWQCFSPGVKVNNTFTYKSIKPVGDGVSKDTAYYFPKCHTASESIKTCYSYLEKEGYIIENRRLGGVGDGVVYDIYETNKGTIWFKVPKMSF